MFPKTPKTRFPHCAALCQTLFALGLLTGCISSSHDPLIAPDVVVAPYDVASGDVLWAVIPLRNESGTSGANIFDMSDKIVAAVEQVHGVRCLPLNRTIETMRALEMTSINSPADALKLATAMGVDAIIVGSITAYDPYDMVVGLSLALVARPGTMRPGSAIAQTIDARRLESAASEHPTQAARTENGIVATASELLDSKNHQVLADVKQYAQGRHRQSAAAGWRTYTTSAPLFSEFAASFTVSRIIQQEWVRLAPEVAARTPKTQERQTLAGER
ncbi:MAG: hypothetical protein AABZ53_16800 [Planctomycetota bacterium]